MQLKKLDQSFYVDNAHLVQALDNINGQWIQGKTRGYGIVVITINHLTFGIPLRTNIRHTASYPTVGKHGSQHKGLDFSKALLISDMHHISSEIFKIPTQERNKLNNKEYYITKKFEKYVAYYIKAVKSSDKNILQSEQYRFTTLQNYHIELGLITNR